METGLTSLIESLLAPTLEKETDRIRERQREREREEEEEERKRREGRDSVKTSSVRATRSSAVRCRSVSFCVDSFFFFFFFFAKGN